MRIENRQTVSDDFGSSIRQTVSDELEEAFFRLGFSQQSGYSASCKNCRNTTVLPSKVCK